MNNNCLQICDVQIQPGEKITLALPTPELYSCAPIYIPAHIYHGKKAGPTLLICGAMHGDEINGVAILQRLMKLQQLQKIRGTLIVIPTINIYGLMTMSRNLPDRRDIEGSFPGSKTGSYASRLASFLSEEIFSKITHCIDLHTGEPNISKFPQVRVYMESQESLELAHHFKAPVIAEANLDEGMLWLSKRETNPIPSIIFEGGEALRLDYTSIKFGVQGIIKTMRSIGMLSAASAKKVINSKSTELVKEVWVRAPSSGLCETYGKIGTFISKGDLVAKISDPFGMNTSCDINAPFGGVIIGKNNLPILNEGEPILQIAEMKKGAADKITNWHIEPPSPQ